MLTREPKRSILDPNHQATGLTPSPNREDIADGGYVDSPPVAAASSSSSSGGGGGASYPHHYHTVHAVAVPRLTSQLSICSSLSLSRAGSNSRLDSAPSTAGGGGGDNTQEARPRARNLFISTSLAPSFPFLNRQFLAIQKDSAAGGLESDFGPTGSPSTL